jgi:hypothetical protein
MNDHMSRCRFGGHHHCFTVLSAMMRQRTIVVARKFYGIPISQAGDPSRKRILLEANCVLPHGPKLFAREANSEAALRSDRGERHDNLSMDKQY